MTAPTEPTGVPSPCIGTCKLDAANVCIGCRRTLAEIAEWSGAGDERRLAILRHVEARS
ncbi:MAG TPA: DUF1289 domain-containing protein [Steroidobacteraceae bacterium]|jgi:hypothetical protein|nr:DUF1289 domain-containing protein [Steroidobacteraceae bacterium]